MWCDYAQDDVISRKMSKKTLGVNESRRHDAAKTKVLIISNPGPLFLFVDNAIVQWYLRPTFRVPKNANN